MLATLAIISLATAKSVNYTLGNSKFTGSTNKDNTTGIVTGNYVWTNNQSGNASKPFYWATAYQAGDKKNVTYKKKFFGKTIQKTKERYTTGMVSEIFEVSKYLWFALDSWGKQNADSNMPQCSTAQQCGNGDRMRENKCCAGISIKCHKTGKQKYIYRCMSKGLIKARMNFKLKDRLAVDIKCAKGSWKKSAAAYLTGAIATAAAVATLF